MSETRTTIFYVKGERGQDGGTGADGRGIQGIPGMPGPPSTVPGPRGFTGNPGLGPQGTPGQNGAASTVPGPQGPPGPRGNDGPPGVGPQGPQGHDGAQGAPGNANNKLSVSYAVTMSNDTMDPRNPAMRSFVNNSLLFGTSFPSIYNSYSRTNTDPESIGFYGPSTDPGSSNPMIALYGVTPPSDLTRINIAPGAFNTDIYVFIDPAIVSPTPIQIELLPQLGNANGDAVFAQIVNIIPVAIVEDGGDINALPELMDIHVYTVSPIDFTLGQDNTVTSQEMSTFTMQGLFMTWLPTIDSRVSSSGTFKLPYIYRSVYNNNIISAFSLDASTDFSTITTPAQLAAKANINIGNFTNTTYTSQLEDYSQQVILRAFAHPLLPWITSAPYNTIGMLVQPGVVHAGNLLNNTAIPPSFNVYGITYNASMNQNTTIDYTSIGTLPGVDAIGSNKPIILIAPFPANGQTVETTVTIRYNFDPVTGTEERTILPIGVMNVSSAGVQTIETYQFQDVLDITTITPTLPSSLTYNYNVSTQFYEMVITYSAHTDNSITHEVTIDRV